MIQTNKLDPECGGSGQPPCQLDRVGPAGFFFRANGLRGNSLGVAPSAVFGHGAWNIDWGPLPHDPPGMQDGRPHRNGVMDTPDATATLPMTNVGHRRRRDRRRSRSARRGRELRQRESDRRRSLQPLPRRHRLGGSRWRHLLRPGRGQGRRRRHDRRRGLVRGDGAGRRLRDSDPRPGPAAGDVLGRRPAGARRRRRGRRRRACSSTTRCRSPACSRAPRARCW